MQRQKEKESWGAWVGQSVKRPTLGFSSGHDMVYEFKPCIGLHTDSTELTWDSLSPSVSASPLLSLSLKTNTLKRKLKKKSERIITAKYT